MSNMNKAIEAPAGAQVTVTPALIKVKGPAGELSRDIPDGIKLSYDQAARRITVERTQEGREARTRHGLERALIKNMVVGVTRGYKKEMEIHGTGYQAAVKGDSLVLQVGYCHEVKLSIPKGLDVQVTTAQAQPDNPARFIIRGADKGLLGQFAADVRAVRPPEPYKGKGIRYTGEYVRRKEGKAFAGAG